MVNVDFPFAVTEDKKDLTELQIHRTVIPCFSLYYSLALIKYFEGSVWLQLKSIAVILEPQGTAVCGIGEPWPAMERV